MAQPKAKRRVPKLRHDQARLPENTIKKEKKKKKKREKEKRAACLDPFIREARTAARSSMWEFKTYAAAAASLHRLASSCPLEHEGRAAGAPFA
jgi:hypothetical protein